jgi:hypothetical protein
MTHRALTLVLAAAILAVPATAVSGQTKIYPPGTDCANLPTIAERLLCGRQEFRRQSGVSTQQPTAVPPQPSPPEQQPSMSPPTIDPAPVGDVLPERTGSNH